MLELLLIGAGNSEYLELKLRGKGLNVISQ